MHTNIDVKCFIGVALEGNDDVHLIEKIAGKYFKVTVRMEDKESLQGSVKRSL